MVDRFDPCVCLDSSDDFVSMEVDNCGDWVRYDDYEDLLNKHESLLKASREVLKEVVAGTEWESMALSDLFVEVEKADGINPPTMP